MRHNYRWMIAYLVIGCFYLSACNRESKTEAENSIKPAQVINIAGSSLHRVKLTQAAAHRLDIQTAVVNLATVGGLPRLIIPYSAVIYDPNGNEWVYKQEQALTFIRVPITIESVEKEFAVLLAGPPTGTQIVKVGVSELYGTEFQGIIQP